MPDPNDGPLWKSLAALSTLVSVASLCCAVLLVVLGPTWPRHADAWLEAHSGGLRTQISSFNQTSERNLTALRESLFTVKSPRRRNELDLSVSKPPAIAFGWLSKEYPEAVWIPPRVVAGWSPMQITAALEHCLKSLAPLKVDVEPLPPIRKDACGMLAPVLLRSLGRKPRITIQPPATINCQMVGALDRWLEDTVQPAARAAFGSPVAQIVGSSYACRNIYNRKDDRLSQHAFGNAFDLPTFVLANGRRIHVVLGWGPTARDERPGLVPVVAKPELTKATQGVGLEKSATHRKSDRIKISVAAKTGDPAPSDSKPDSEGTESNKKIDATEAKFLRHVHKEACAVFTTVLGPEANDVHRDHFHFDLQNRAPHSVCQ